MSVRGIEVSDAQGTILPMGVAYAIDWQAVAAGGMVYAVTQATEGTEGMTRTFGKNWDAIKAVGLVRAASHLWRSNADAQSQADRFLETVRLEPGDLPPVLQILPDENPEIEAILAWLNRVERATQKLPILQTHREFWTKIDNPEVLTRFPLWIVDRSMLSIPRLPRGISDWWFWEYGNRSRIAGILTEVRASWFNSCQEGATGNRVRTAQQRLQERGFDPGNLDGAFDLLTEAAVRQFQRSIGLSEDGILGPRTWAHLMAAPTAVAALQPLATLTSNSIQLVSVGQYYQAVPQQTQALDWLQNQLQPETIGEFARRWRQQPTATASIRLVDAAVYYQGSAHQIQAFNWLQQQIPTPILEEFARKWRAVPPPAINLIDVARYYQGLPAQAQALDWLQARVSDAALTEFARLWRNQPTRTSSPIRLVDAAAYYKGEPYQNQAWIWLQRHVSEAALGEFARQWRAAPPLPMRLENVAQYYQGLPYQEAALQWLQEQIPGSIFQEFARRWRG